MQFSLFHRLQALPRPELNLHMEAIVAVIINCHHCLRADQHPRALAFDPPSDNTTRLLPCGLNRGTSGLLVADHLMQTARVLKALASHLLGEE